MQQEYSTLYKEFLSPKSKGPEEFFRNINKLQICYNHHIMLNTIADADLDEHEGRSTQDNSSTITRTLVDVETRMISSKIAHLLKSLLKNKQSNCGPIKSVVYMQWTRLLDLIGIALAHNSILSAQIDGTITARVQEKALENFFNNPECEVIIASIAAAGTGLNITCANMVYLMEHNWNPAIEAPAVDRLHCIGQQQTVKVIHYITPNSVDINMQNVPFKLIFFPDCIIILESFLMGIPYSNHQ
ncbi:hypothetical protein O181_033719 [Austropuccinia psidii MF-1]|uniref:Helicase C-terminal domain-containing protein n=1 Tax=Austropuccinia psidii MF-1 TaxID=1389203 RepID=A0A9Q3H8U1_9BASI|nr:hypothetical protein [Austropuccinia psidii MF-1]